MRAPSYSSPQNVAKVIQGSSVLVGLHPDEATEPIVNVAVKLAKPAAVVRNACMRGLNCVTIVFERIFFLFTAASCGEDLL